VAVLCVCALACGRVHFDKLTDASGGGSGGDDTGGDGQLLDTTVCDDNLPGVLFCEDFEGTQKLVTNEATAPSTVGPDSTRSYRGARSLHSHATRLNEPAWQVGSVLPSVSSGVLYVRWYQYVPAMGQIDMSNMQVIERVMPYHGFQLGMTSARIDLWTNTGASAMVAMTIPRDVWICFRATIAISDTNGAIATYIDEMPGPALFNTDTLPAGGYEDVHGGMFAGNTGTLPQDLWTDELVIGTQPIACD
jgi:hypothetical protein